MHQHDNGSINSIRTNAENKYFYALVTQLDADLKSRDGADHLFYAQYNKANQIKHVVVAFENEMPVGCGAIKEYASDTMEVKRMYVLPTKRGQGIGSIILKELELWTRDLKYKRCLLETGKRQVEAMALYRKNGYAILPNFGQYENVPNSVCFEKILISS